LATLPPDADDEAVGVDDDDGGVDDDEQPAASAAARPRPAIPRKRRDLLIPEKSSTSHNET
jgi:hypothetical protein